MDRLCLSTFIIQLGVFSIKSEMMINDAIRAKEVRVTGATGEQLGIMPTRQAQQMADEQEMDLVLIAPQAEPPVCRIMDYSKYRFEQSKRDKEARKNQKVITLKEVRLSPVIEEHDIGVRVKNCRKFIEEGNKVKVYIMFRGRQMAHTEVGYGILADFLARVEDIAVQERRPLMEGRSMSMILAPKKK